MINAATRRYMFGKWRTALGKAKKFLGKTLSDVSNGSRFLHKGVEQVRGAWKHGKAVVRSVAKDIGGDAGVALANEGIAAVGVAGAPAAAALSFADRQVENAGKAATNLQRNPAVQRFINS